MTSFDAMHLQPLTLHEYCLRVIASQRRELRRKRVEALGSGVCLDSMAP